MEEKKYHYLVEFRDGRYRPECIVMRLDKAKKNVLLIEIDACADTDEILKFREIRIRDLDEYNKLKVKYTLKAHKEEKHLVELSGGHLNDFLFEHRQRMVRKVSVTNYSYLVFSDKLKKYCIAYEIRPDRTEELEIKDESESEDSDEEGLLVKELFGDYKSYANAFVVERISSPLNADEREKELFQLAMKSGKNLIKLKSNSIFSLEDVIFDHIKKYETENKENPKQGVLNYNKE